jgi:hypothetical protein
MHTSLLTVAIMATTALATSFSTSVTATTLTSSPLALATPLFLTPLVPDAVPTAFPTAFPTASPTFNSVPAHVDAFPTSTGTLEAHISLARPRIPIPIFTPRTPKYRPTPTSTPDLVSEPRRYVNYTEQKHHIEFATLVVGESDLRAPSFQDEAPAKEPVA